MKKYFILILIVLLISCSNENLCKTKKDEDQLNCYSNLAILQESSEPCNEFYLLKVPYYDQCVFNLANKTKKYQECDKITNSDLKRKCFAIIYRFSNKSFCNKSDFFSKKDCFFMMAEETLNSKYCEDLVSIKNQTYYNSFYNSCLGRIVKLSNSLELCKKINSSTKAISDNCFTNLAINNNNETICQNYVDETFYKDHCYLKIAKQKKDLLLCNRINDSKIKATCLY